jgi:hypothetical protein
MSSALLDWRLWLKIRMFGKSGIHKYQCSRGLSGSPERTAQKSLPRKTSKLNATAT